ncbi:patatin-like protein 3 [Panicum miliaceum]|uniref:Patatin n=1 Tax=Panicum miliaceum TaxID=4540 RepID=A0A3L6RA89_PANMI|nr:patatin-like protein 3 [Panicum miliaceum]
MASPPADVDLGKLSYEIFSLLESKFLFGGAAGVGSVPGTPARAAAGEDRGRVRVLAIDGCGPGPGDALLAAVALARLEAALRERAGDPDARVADFFDAAAGAGAGGVLAAMLFLKGEDGRARYTAADALAFVAASLGRRQGGWGGEGARRSRWAALLFRRGERSPLRRVFGDATLRDTVAPLLVPCFDLATAAPFLFSRADAVESDSFDFRLRDVCAATCAGGAAAAAVRSVDGRTAIAAASGGVAAMSNPAAAAITHVLHNKQEFPLAVGVDDLLVVSIGSGSSAAAVAASATPSGGWQTPIPPRSPSPAEMVRLTAEGVADMVDQAVAMAFGHTCGRNYVRIQAASPACSGKKALSSLDAKKAVAVADGMLTQRNVEAELFRLRRLSEKSNREKLDAFAAELVKEHERRARSPGLPNVVIKQVAATPRPSSATTASSATATARTASTMPSPASQGSYGH